MATHPPVVFHQPKHAHSEPSRYDVHPHRARLPVIPDLRFEYSYLRSVRQYIEFQPPTDSAGSESVARDAPEDPSYVTVDIPGNGKRKGKEVVSIQWNRVAWVTVRDQVISPLLQGALWAVASYCLSPFFMQLGSQTGAFVRSHLPSKEGLGAGWLRDFIRKIGISASREQPSQRS